MAVFIRVSRMMARCLLLITLGWLIAACGATAIPPTVPATGVPTPVPPTAVSSAPPASLLPQATPPSASASPQAAPLTPTARPDGDPLPPSITGFTGTLLFASPNPDPALWEEALIWEATAAGVQPTTRFQTNGFLTVMPNGRQAILYYYGGEWRDYTLTHTTGATQTLALHCPGACFPLLSPDGTQAAVTASCALEQEMVVTGALGAIPQLVDQLWGQCTTQERAVAWLPDGEGMLVETLDGIIVRTSGQPDRMIAPGIWHEPRLSADGATLLASSYTNLQFTLWRIAIATGERTQFTIPNYHPHMGLLSPDGQLLAFTEATGDPEQCVYVVALSAPQQPACLAKGDRLLAWAP